MARPTRIGRARLPAGPRREGGFTYLAVLLTIAIFSAGIGTAAEVWHTARQREKERELLFVGEQLRQAIGRYYQHSPGPGRTYPRKLEDLLRDPRQQNLQRHLRKLYRDPITGLPEWGLLKAPDGGIMGVYSRSRERPLKKNGFAPVQRGFDTAKAYADWQFVYLPQASPAAALIQKPAIKSVDGRLQ